MIDLRTYDITGQKIRCALDTGKPAVHCVRNRFGRSCFGKPGHGLDQNMAVGYNRCDERVLEAVLTHDSFRKIVRQLSDRVLREIEILFLYLTALNFHFFGSSVNCMIIIFFIGQYP